MGAIFGGDCHRFRRIDQATKDAHFTNPGTQNDTRWAQLQKELVAVKETLAEEGVSEEWVEQDPPGELSCGFRRRRISGPFGPLCASRGVVVLQHHFEQGVGS